jgi:hypothetical protein
MKRIIMISVLLLVASGCATTAQTQNSNAPATSTNTNAAATTTTTTTTTTAATSDDDHIAREKQVWELLKKKDYDSFASMLADDQVEVSAGGVHDKAGSVAGVKQNDFSTATLSDFKVVKIDDDAVVVTYLVKATAPEANPGGYRESTVWSNRGGKWVAVFHQGTPVAAASPQPK